MFDLRSFVPSLCRWMGIPRPALAKQDPYLPDLPGGRRLSKALIYCPDAFGVHALQKYPFFHEELAATSTHQTELKAVLPSVTPVCFATLFTGGAPVDHGIVTYAKPQLRCDTVFDSYLRAGKRVAIVAVQNSSVDQIFRGRPMDYFSMGYDSLVTAKVLELLKQNQHDLIVAYHQEYDDLLHETEPFSRLAEKALRNHIESWKILLEGASQAWKKDYVVAFTPDHGAHLDLQTGHGDHGDDRPEDLNLKHFFFVK